MKLICKFDKTATIERNGFPKINGSIQTMLSFLLFATGLCSHIQDVDNYLRFSDSTNDLYIEEGLKSVTREVFAKYKKISSVWIPSTVTNIELNAFDGMMRLENIFVSSENSKYANYKKDGILYNKNLNQILKIPAKKKTLFVNEFVKKIDKNLFWETKLEAIDVDKNNKNFTCFMTDNILYSKDQSVLFRYSLSNGDEFVVPFSVKRIEKNAFYCCDKLRTISIPALLTTIEENAFYGCSRLQSIVIPQSLTKIKKSTFMKCTSLSSVTIPSSIVSIDDYAFCRCNSLKNILIPSSVKHIGKHSFEFTAIKTIRIPYSITSIGEYAFDNCFDLESISVDSNNKEFSNHERDGVLYDKEYHTLIKYPCGKYGNFTVPSSVRKFSNNAFHNSHKLTSIVMSNIRNIGSMPFLNCLSLETISFSSYNLIYSDNKNSGVLFSNNKKNLISYPCNHKGFIYKIPSSVKTISPYAFSRCKRLKEVIIPPSVSKIEKETYSFCSSLERVILPPSIISISTKAFHHCSKLSTVLIPSSVSEIGKKAFAYCPEIKEFTYCGNIDFSTPSTFKESQLNISVIVSYDYLNQSFSSLPIKQQDLSNKCIKPIIKHNQEAINLKQIVLYTLLFIVGINIGLLFI